MEAATGLPKKALTAYLFFQQYEKEKVKLQNPRISATALNRHIADTWKGLGIDDRVIYEDLEKQD